LGELVNYVDLTTISADAALAARIASEAGERLLSARIDWGASPDELKAHGDAVSQIVLAERLAAERPDDAVLSEEASDDPRRLQADRVWIIDPLDGTREYSEGRSDWAVHVALWRRDADLVGAIALPAEGAVLASDPAPERTERRPGPLRMAVSRTRPPQIALDVAERLGFELVSMGSAGYKIAAVVRGDVDAYVHAGGQYQWDSAAPVAVALAAGVHASRLDGSTLRYNEPDVYLPDLVVAAPELADRLLDALVELGAR
jgi:3'(2'), 5'-bisphosphate nucleotidase